MNPMGKPLRITWINPGQIELRNGHPTARRVDIRLRCIGPGVELMKRGWDLAAVSMFDFHQWANQASFYDRDIFVVGKAFVDISPIIHRVHQMKHKVIIDLCDNVFEPPEDGLKHIYQSILPLADGLVASSEQLRLT